MKYREERRPLPPVTGRERRELRGAFEAHKQGDDRLQSPPWVIAKRFTDPDDPNVLASIVGVCPVEGDPWLVRGMLRAAKDGPPTLSRLCIEHFEDPGREVTGPVVRGVHVGHVRNHAIAWLDNQDVIKDVLGGTPAEKKWARRVTAEAAKLPLNRGRKGYPPEHYQRIAIRAVELFDQGRRDVLKTIHAEENRPYQTVRDWIGKARKLGYLAPATKQGRSDFRPGPNLYPKEEPNA